MALERRAFLQRLGFILAALGMADAGLTGANSAYQQALAQPARRRLALLVGINQYPGSVWQGGNGSGRGGFLRGCRTDVELQRQLLIYRFGFAPEDVVTLVDEQATHRAILDSLRSHLIDQAQPGDAVLFHFSGLGSQVQLSDRADQLFRTLVPVDGYLPNESSPIIRDLFEDLLKHLLRQLPTRQVTTVIDASAVNREIPLRGNLRVRSRTLVPTGQASAEVADILGGSSAESSSEAYWPGLLLRASALDAMALEGDWPGFSAGIFTYALTQQLWSTSPGQQRQWVFRHVAMAMQQWMGSRVTPQLSGHPPTDNTVFYGGGSLQPLPADGVIQSVNPEERTAQLWLGGLSAPVLAYSQEGFQFRVVAASDTPSASAADGSAALTLRYRNGLMATAHVSQPEPLIAGQLVVETVRVLPRSISLNVALDSDLERIERVDATSALSGIPYVSAAPTGEQMVDCLFGRVQPPAAPTLTAVVPTPEGVTDVQSNLSQEQAPPQPGYGLFSPDHTLIPGTTSEEPEAVKTAVGRLSDHLQSLLAAKLLRLTANPLSSELSVRLALESAAPEGQTLGYEETLRSLARPNAVPHRRDRASMISLADVDTSRLQFRISNFSDRSLHYLLLILDQQNRLLVYCPAISGPQLPEEPLEAIMAAARLSPGSPQVVPESAAGWLFKHQAGAVETFAVVSTVPFQRTWQTLRDQGTALQGDRLISLSRPLPVAQAVLSDLSAASANGEGNGWEHSSALRLKTSAWATLVMMYRTEAV